jgi:saccharopine dehydrogenase-like NADP-dependent oxidoreductase
VALDVRDGAALRVALAQSDAVMNTSGPFYALAVPILRAAIDARRDYIDICDDWEPTLEMLALHDAARQAGITAVVGMGSTPGVSNLLAQLAAGELDVVRELVTGWNLDAAQPEPSAPGDGVSAALLHGIRQMTGTIQVYRDGRPTEDRPLRKFVIDYPGLGPRTVRTFGHPEPLTLPRTFAAVERSVNAVHSRSGLLAFAPALRWLIESGALSASQAARLVARLEGWLPAPTANAMYREASLPPLYAYAAGGRGGSGAAVGVALFRPVGFTMGSNTGIPLAIGLELLARGEVKSRGGVFAPEAAFDASTVLERLRPYCVGPDLADLVVVTRSWDPASGERYREAVRATRRAVPAPPAATP